MVGTINSVINPSKLNSSLQVKCSFRMVNSSSFIKIMGTINYNSGLNKVKIGWNPLKLKNLYFGKSEIRMPKSIRIT